MPDDPAADPRAFDAAQEAEWNEYVAVAPIFVGGARAFNPGDPVPKSHVTNGVVSKDDVAKRNTKAAEAVTAPAGTES